MEQEYISSSTDRTTEKQPTTPGPILFFSKVQQSQKSDTGDNIELVILIVSLGVFLILAFLMKRLRKKISLTTSKDNYVPHLSEPPPDYTVALKMPKPSCPCVTRDCRPETRCSCSHLSEITPTSDPKVLESDKMNKVCDCSLKPFIVSMEMIGNCDLSTYLPSYQEYMAQIHL